MEAHGVKRPTSSDQLSLLDGVKAVLLDVEGTTTPIFFVKEVLIPYARDNLEAYIKANFENDELQSGIDAIRLQATADKDAGVEGVTEIPPKDGATDDIINAIVLYITPQLDKDTQNVATRRLLEQVWREAYKTDAVQGEVYDDVMPMLRQIVSESIKVFSFSAEDSEEAQRLLFSYSNQGDLTEFFTAHFDTTVGSKVDKNTYKSIVEKIALAPTTILYITDLTEEATAAHEAGLKTCIIVRECNAALSDEDYQTFNVIYGLNELVEDDEEVPAKKRHDDGGAYAYDEYVSTDGATNDSEPVLGDDDGDDEFGAGGEHTGESDNGESRDG